MTADQPTWCMVQIGRQLDDVELLVKPVAINCTALLTDRSLFFLFFLCMGVVAAWAGLPGPTQNIGWVGNIAFAPANILYIIV